MQWLFNESPVRDTIVINDRWGKETRGKHGGYYTTEYDLVHTDNAENKEFNKPWEECRGMAGSFGYNRNENLEDYSSSEELVHILINKVARGGNLLLNVGPTSDGRIPVIMQQRLSDIGKWLKINGDAIFDTNKWDSAPQVTTKTNMFYTKKGSDLYAIATIFPESVLTIEKLPKGRKPTSVRLLGYTKNEIKYDVDLDNGKILITPPYITPSTTPCLYAWVFKIENILV